MPTTYNVADFTDLELYSLLELSNKPTDSELEARIIQMLQRHMYLRTESGKQLFQFFKDIYEHFFDIQKNTPSLEDDFDHSLDELEKKNFDPQSEKSKKQQEMNEKLSQPTQVALNQAKEQNFQASKSNDEIKKDPVAFTKELLFAPGKINPLLKETYTRTISIDSQYRDQEYASSTDFTVNFNETLKDVVKMKLYAVQIPVTWYTISNSYGSNFFYLKPREVLDGSYNTLAIYGKSNHEYKIEIPPGNYDAPQLTTAVNKAISEAAKIYPDVSFGNTKLEYNTSTVKTTFSFDIQKVYNEFSYSVSYGPKSRSLLGIRDTSNVPMTTMYTDFLYDDISMNGNLWPLISLTKSQRTLSLTQYKSIDAIYTPDISLNSISIELDGTRKTWANWIASINATLQTHPLLIDSSLEVIVDISGNHSFQWILIPNREKVPHIVGAKWVLIRSDEVVNFEILLEDKYSILGSQSSTTRTTITNRTTMISDEEILFRPIKDYFGGVYISEEDESNNITLSIPDGNYTVSDLIDTINDLFTSNPILNESTLSMEQEINTSTAPTNPNMTITTTTTTITPFYNINKIYTSRDYKVVFYDINSFSKCTNASASYRNATIDTTLGYILGFHLEPEYEFHSSFTYQNPFTVNDTVITNGNIINTLVTLTSDSVVNVYLYTYFMIILDDFNQNHLNDGLVTLSKRDYSVTLPSYANRKLAKQCNPVTNTISDVLNNTSASANNLTQKQVYSVEQILAEQNKQRDNFNQGVYVRDMFALLPVKTSGATPGSIYVEFGGTLQQQERVYFGPVNIRRISVKLVNDKGDVVDLNGGNWSFQLVCEQLYQRGETS